MALTITTTDKAIRIDHWVKGMKIRQVDIVTSTGGGSSDYSTGFDIQGNANLFGFHVIFAVIPQMAYVQAGTALPLLFYSYDPVTGKLRVADATSEAHGAGTIDAGGKITALIIGV